MIRWRLIVFSILALFASYSASLGDPPAGERTIKAFHRGDFNGIAGRMAQVPPLSFGQSGSFSGWAWGPLFDGTAESSLIIEFGSGRNVFGGSTPGTNDHDLFTVDNPPINQTEGAIVGRWAAPTYGANCKEMVSEITLTLAVDYGGLTQTIAVAHLHDIGDTATTYQAFRLPIAPPPPKAHARRITVSLRTWTDVPILLEDIRLVESGGAKTPAASPPTAGLPPADLIPKASDIAPQFDFSSWYDGQSGLAPVVMEVRTSADQTLRFCRRPADGSPRRVSMLSMDAPPISAGDFGVTGTIDYAGLGGQGEFDGSAYFELTAWFPDGTSRIVGTTAPFGPAQMISGHSGDRPMQLVMHSTMQPTRLQLELVSDGIGQVAFQNISFVQFLPPLAVANSVATVSPSAWNDRRLIRGTGWSSVVAAMLLAIGTISMPQFGVLRSAGPIIMLVVGEVLFAWAMFLLGGREEVRTIAPLFAGAIAWVLPLQAARLAVRRVHERELRKMLTIDAG
jgi:hypothetical protein